MSSKRTGMAGSVDIVSVALLHPHRAGLRVGPFCDYACPVGESAGVKTAFALPGGVDDLPGTLDPVEEWLESAVPRAEAEVKSACVLHRAAGRIKLEEEEWDCAFFSGGKLAAVLEQAGSRSAQVDSSFGGQAAVVQTML